MVRYHLIKVGLVLALLATACGDDGDTAATNDATPTTIETVADDAATVDDSVPESDAGDDEPVTLTASEKGVTAEVIRLGVLFPDLSVIGTDNGDLEAKFQVPIDEINANGGINGRQIELHFEGVNPLDDIEFDEKCTSLTQDVEVFAAIGVFLRDQVLCFVEINETIAINHFEATTEHVERARVPMVVVPARADRLVELNTAALIDNGILAAGDRVAIHGIAGSEDLHEQFRAELEASSVVVVSDTVMQNGGDLAAIVADMAVFAEKWAADGADAVIATVNAAAGPIFSGVESTGLDIDVILPNGLDRPPNVLRQALGVGDSFDQGVALIADESSVPQWAADVNGVRECAARFEAATGETIYTTENGDEPLENLGPSMVACELVDLFAALATEAGPDLTYESFQAAMDSIGEFSITGVSAGSLGPGKADYSDSLPGVARYNPDTDSFELG
ncbi:MAG: hypothetical protein AAF548_00090 [Actinomycetota bacterium]